MRIIYSAECQPFDLMMMTEENFTFTFRSDGRLTDINTLELRCGKCFQREIKIPAYNAVQICNGILFNIFANQITDGHLSKQFSFIEPIKSLSINDLSTIFQRSKKNNNNASTDSIKRKKTVTSRASPSSVSFNSPAALTHLSLYPEHRSRSAERTLFSRHPLRRMLINVAKTKAMLGGRN